jgi:hypothetical protein
MDVHATPVVSPFLSSLSETEKSSAVAPAMCSIREIPCPVKVDRLRNRCWRERSKSEYVLKTAFPALILYLVNSRKHATVLYQDE